MLTKTGLGFGFCSHKLMQIHTAATHQTISRLRTITTIPTRFVMATNANATQACQEE